jgi:hypothetical protein
MLAHFIQQGLVRRSASLPVFASASKPVFLRLRNKIESLKHVHSIQFQQTSNSLYANTEITTTENHGSNKGQGFESNQKI